MTELDLMKLLKRLEAQSRREFIPPPGGEEPNIPPRDAPPPCVKGPNPPPGDVPPPPMPMHHGRGRIISVLFHHSGITQKELSERLAIRPQSLSDALSKLEADGVIFRERSETDKRELRLYLTDSGKELADNIYRKRQERAADFFSSLTEDEKETLGALLEKLCLANEEEKH